MERQLQQVKKLIFQSLKGTWKDNYYLYCKLQHSGLKQNLSGLFLIVLMVNGISSQNGKVALVKLNLALKHISDSAESVRCLVEDQPLASVHDFLAEVESSPKPFLARIWRPRTSSLSENCLYCSKEDDGILVNPRRLY